MVGNKKKSESGCQLAEVAKELVYNYWTHDASRPTGNKKDILTVDTEWNATVHIVQHVKHIQEKSQTEAKTFLCTFYIVVVRDRWRETDLELKEAKGICQ